MTPAETYKTLCARCHGEKGDGNGKVAWYLDPSPRDFTKAAFMNSKPRERFVELDSARACRAPPCRPGARPSSDEQVERRAELRAGRPSRRSRSGELKPRKRAGAEPGGGIECESIARGEKIFLQRCTGCHGPQGGRQGSELARHSAASAQPAQQLRSWTSVADRRLFESILYGVQGTAMPAWIDYGLSQQDVGDIVNFIRSINQKSGSQQYARN